MRKQYFNFHWVFLTICLLSNSIDSQAAESYARIHSEKTDVYIGEVFPVYIFVKSDQQPTPPELKTLTKFNTKLVARESSKKESNLCIFRYTFRAKQSGKQKIPVLSISSGSEELKTEPITINVKMPKKTNKMILEMKLNKTQCYVGEPVILTCTWISQIPLSSIKAVDFHFPIFYDNRFEVLDPFISADEQKNGKFTGLPVSNTRILAKQLSRNMGKQKVQALSFEKILIPKNPSGKINLPAGLLLCAENSSSSNKRHRNAFQYPAYFDNTFFDQNLEDSNYQKVYIDSNKLNLEIKPLPERKQPDNFSGLVGDFSIETSATPVQVRVGDPITLTVKVSAAEHGETVDFPPLSNQNKLSQLFEIPKERGLPELSNKSKTYTQSIRPKSINSTEIPSIDLVFFNPKTAAFQSIKSKPIPLKINPADTAITFAGNNTIVIQDTNTSANPGLGWNLFTAKIFLGTIILIILSFFAGRISLGINWLHKKPTRSQKAFSEFRKNTKRISGVEKTEVYRGLYSALRNYFASRLELNPQTITFEQIRYQLGNRQVDEDLLSNIKNVFQTCEAYCFTQGFDDKVEVNSIVNPVQNTIKQLEQSLKR